jgi:hypothetical protein
MGEGQQFYFKIKTQVLNRLLLRDTYKPTKTFNKLANRLEKNKAFTNYVMVLSGLRDIDQALHKTYAPDLWGISRTYSKQLREN